ncbi:hypothetical protein BJX99DRAFT_262355 [Aspergillus californicus]
MEGRPSKRQRICRACDQCRRRKSKCDGEQPVCKICDVAGRTCSYENGGGRRGLPTGYVRGLEAVLGLILEHVPGSENRLFGLLHGCSSAAGRDRAVDKWRKSKIAPHVSDIWLSEFQDKLTTEIVADDSEWDIPEPLDMAVAAERQSEAVRPPRLLPSPEQIAPVDISTSPLPSDVADLVDFYFVHIHSWFPILERRDLLRAMYTYPQTGAPQPLLWAVITYSSVFRGEHPVGPLDEMEVIDSIKRAILASHNTVQLAHVQALVVLVLVHIGMQDIHTAWVLIGHASRMLATLPEGSRNGLFTNTFHGCNFLDNAISAVLNRAPCLSMEEQTAPGLVGEDGVEEWESWTISKTNTTRPTGPLRSLSAFNLLQQLMEPLAAVLYSPDDNPHAEHLLNSVQAKEKSILEQRPYPGSHSALPPLIQLHLTSSFVILSAIRRFWVVTKDRTDLILLVSSRMIGLMEDYAALTETCVSPLLHLFALQCQHCIAQGTLVANNADLSVSTRGISARLQTFLRTPLRRPNKLDNTVCHNNNEPTIALDEAPTSFGKAIGEHARYREPSFSILNQGPYATPISQPTTDSGANLPYTSISDDTDGFDALFQELVTSIPDTRLEPTFAQNLGFYTDEMDEEFLTQLNMPPSG